MRQPETTTQLQIVTDALEPSAISDAEARQLRQEKLDAIRKAIGSGAFDSDALLEKAISRMVQRLENPDEPPFH